MGIELFFVCLAIFLVPFSNGSTLKLLSTNFRSKRALLFVLAGFVTLEFIKLPQSRFDDVGFAILMATYVFAIGFCVANITLKGIWLAFIGLCSNAIVIALNLGMPVTSTNDLVAKESIRYQVETSKDLLKPLSNNIVIDALKISLSPGDIIFALGALATCYLLSRKYTKVKVPDGQTEDEFELEEIYDENFAEREEIDDSYEPEMQDPLRERIEIIIADPAEQISPTPATSLEDDLEFIHQAQILENVENNKSNEGDSEDYEIVEPATPEIKLNPIFTNQKFEEAKIAGDVNEVQEKIEIDLEEPKIEAKIESKKYRGASNRRSKRKQNSKLPSKEELGFEEDSMEIVDAAN